MRSDLRVELPQVRHPRALPLTIPQTQNSGARTTDLAPVLSSSPTHLGSMPPPLSFGTLAVSRHVAAKAL